MRDLLSIGQFAEVTELSVKALRLYDKLGLLPPAMVDFASGYRYYSRDQVGRAKRIRLLRSLHMPLAEIGNLLRADDPAAVTRTLDEVKRMVAGPGGVVICDECVTQCNDIFATEEARETSA